MVAARCCLRCRFPLLHCILVFCVFSLAQTTCEVVDVDYGDSCDPLVLSGFRDATHNSTVASAVLHKREKRDYTDPDYYAGNEIPEETEPRYMMFSAIMFLDAILIFVLLFTSLYAPRMIDLPVRWHTINYSCWNLFQLLIFANCADESGMHDFLKNEYIANNCDFIQEMTLTIYPVSMLFIIPSTYLMYFSPSVKFSPSMRYYVWIPLLFSLDTLDFMLYGSSPWAWSIEEKPLAYYQALVNLGSLLFMISTILITVSCILKYIVYLCQYRSQAQLNHFTSMLNIVLFGVYVVCNAMLHSPFNGVQMGQFLAGKLMKYLPAWLLDLVPYLMDFVTYMLTIFQEYALFIPVAEFLTTFVCIPMYRSQVFQVFTCGQNLHIVQRRTTRVGATNNEVKIPLGSPDLSEDQARPSTAQIQLVSGYYHGNQ